MTKIKIVICGIQGYVGRELLRLVSNHPYLEIGGFLVRNSTDKVYAEMVAIAGKNIPIYSLDEINPQAMNIDVLLLATPPDASMEIVAALINSSIKIIDLSGAFRLEEDEFNQWYDVKHSIPELLKNAYYGLSPWGVIENNNKQLIANPGCYATCALMALIPVLKENIINKNTIVIDAKSGVSGAGKKPNPNLSFTEMAENFFPYKIGKHQHIPEINKALTHFTDQPCNVTLVTHMLPIKRGISMSIYAEIKHNDYAAAAIEAAYQSAYKNYPLVKFGEINQGNSENDNYLLSLKTVVGTPKTHIAYFVDKGKLFIFASIDNLLKGAASQTIENINTMYDLPIETGLQLI